MNDKKIISLVIIAVMLILNSTVAFAAKYEYDELGRLITASYDTENDNSDENNKLAQYSYDAGGNITSVLGFTENENPTETTTQVVISEKVWNYTTGENTDNFYTVSANDWSSAVAVSYGDLTLTAAVKLESNSEISFETANAGTLKLVTYSTKEEPTVLLNGTSIAVSSNGVVEIPIDEAGTYTITRGTTNTYIYYMCYTYETVIYSGAKYIWNYTTGENTDDFYTVSANDWNSAVSVTYGDEVLTKAVKLETDTLITFNAPSAGTLTLVTYSAKTAPAVTINNQSLSVSVNGSTEINLSEAGEYTISKNTTNTYLYYICFTLE